MSVTGESLVDDDDAATSLLDDDDELHSVAGSDSTAPAVSSAAARRSRQHLQQLQQSTGRCASIGMLMRDGLLEPGQGVMAIEYMGQTFRGDLLADGQIRSQETDDVFTSPSSWAVHCKKIINPDKKSGCGWSGVKYKGKKLEHYKNLLFKKRRELVQEQESHEDDYDPAEDDEKKAQIRKKQDLIQKIIVKHEMLGSRSHDHDPCTLVECVPFSELNKMQPFLVSVTSTALTVMGLHCHLTDSEVLGYLAGKWDVNTHELSVTHAFPCRCRLSEKSRSRRVEYDIFTAIQERNLTLVGWYHSHPHSPPTPTIRDSDQQLEYEIRMKGGSDASYTPCVGMIYTPFSKNRKRPMQSNLLCYWVMPPHEMRPNDYPRPLAMEYTVNRDACIHSDALNEMSLCAEYYRGAPDAVNFTRPLADGGTGWERLKAALEPCAPSGPAARLTDYLHALLFPRPGALCPEQMLSGPAAVDRPQPQSVAVFVAGDDGGAADVDVKAAQAQGRLREGAACDLTLANARPSAETLAAMEDEVPFDLTSTVMASSEVNSPPAPSRGTLDNANNSSDVRRFEVGENLLTALEREQSAQPLMLTSTPKSKVIEGTALAAALLQGTNTDGATSISSDQQRRSVSPLALTLSTSAFPAPPLTTSAPRVQENPDGDTCAAAMSADSDEEPRMVIDESVEI